MEDKDENWIPCFGEECKGKNIIVGFYRKNINYIFCGNRDGFQNGILVECKNGENIIIEDALCKCPYKMEWYICEFGVFKKRNDMIERMKEIGFNVEVKNCEDGSISICSERKITGDKNAKDI